jgi:hypothetical protein
MHGSNVCIEWWREGKNNGNPDEVELGGRTEEGKKWRTLQKVKNYGAHNTRSQALHIMYLTQ